MRKKQENQNYKQNLHQFWLQLHQFQPQLHQNSDIKIWGKVFNFDVILMSSHSAR